MDILLLGHDVLFRQSAILLQLPDSLHNLDHLVLNLDKVSVRESHVVVLLVDANAQHAGEFRRRQIMKKILEEKLEEQELVPRSDLFHKHPLKQEKYEATAAAFHGHRVVLIDVLQVLENGDSRMQFGEQTQLLFAHFTREFFLLRLQRGQNIRKRVQIVLSCRRKQRSRSAKQPKHNGDYMEGGGTGQIFFSPAVSCNTTCFS